jgi:Tol biopolymer transport system component
MNRKNLYLGIISFGLLYSFQYHASSAPNNQNDNPIISPTLSFAAKGLDGYTHVYTFSSGMTRQLTSGPYNDETPEWSFDGKRIVFLRADSNSIGVYIMNADGSDLKRLSPNPSNDTLPAFSPDGSKIIFTLVVSLNSCNGGLSPTTSIATMSAADGSQRTIIFDGTKQATCFNGAPRFSPDGSKIAFMCSPYNLGSQVCTISSNGLQYLTSSAYTVSGDPHWSPDGTKIAISHKDTSGNVNVWTINPDGSNLTQVTKFTEPNEAGDAGWSSDGTQLIFEQDYNGNGQSNPNARASIYVVSPTGSESFPLGIPCSGVGCAPRFKPR